MLSTHLFRPRFVALSILVAQLAVGIALADAGDTPPQQVAPPPVRRAMWDFDRFLDHHPLLEDDLRLAPALVEDKEFLEKNPEFRDFLSANPAVLQGLKRFPRYFLFRALLRQASVPVRHFGIGKLKEVLDKDPSLEKALVQTPDLIRDRAFLEKHTALLDLIRQNPALRQAFLPEDARQKSVESSE